MSNAREIECDNLNLSLELYTGNGFRLDMIFPADSPREALVSKGNQIVRLIQKFPEVKKPEILVERSADAFAQDDASSTWVKGRAGMEYRDLIPGRLDGKIIVSHIRLPFAGVVPDSVHYHKIDFQMIYCKRGRIQVVYEDQGPPFWLETGDCILQPPEIRHRVLYSEAGAEVIEVSSPAEHVTWIDHELLLPTSALNPEKDFGGSKFVHHRSKTSVDLLDSYERDTGIGAATGGRFDLRIRRTGGTDTALLLELNGLGSAADNGQKVPISIEIPI